MTVVALIVTPIVLLYQGWTYHVFRARVTGQKLQLDATDLTARADGNSSRGAGGGSPP